MADSSPSKPRPSRTVKEGWTMKQGPPPWKTWKKRYLALNDTGLFYFISAKKTKADLKGSIALASISLIQHMTESKRKFCMKIETAGHNFLFAFEEEKELKGWVDAIEKEKDKNKQGTLKKMKKRESQPRLEDLFTPPQPTSAPPSTTSTTTTPSPASAALPTSSPQMSKGSRRAAAKEKRKLEKEKEKEEKGREKEKKEKKKNDKKVVGKTPSSVKKIIEEKGPAPTPPSAETKYIRTSKGEKLPKHHKGGKKEGSESEEDTSDFRTMLVHPHQHDTGEFREYLPEPESELPEPRGSFPTHEELSQLSQSKLKEADQAIDIERDAQIRVIKAKYAAKKIEIIDTIVNKEVAAIKQKYADRRKNILQELKNRGIEAS